MPVIILHDVLSEEHVPRSMTGKEAQLKEVLFYLSPAAKRRKPINVWIYGESGTGKTAAARLLLQQMKEEGVQGVYVNCWEDRTLFAVAHRIVYELRILGSDMHSIGSKLAGIRKFLDGKPVLIVLDEIDKPPPKHRAGILYALSTLGSIGLVCVCNDEHLFHSLEERVRSRLMPARIPFPAYSTDQIAAILKERAEQALYEEAWDLSTLETIAAHSGGNARRAIQTLRRAAEYAEARGELHIRKTLKAAFADLNSNGHLHILAKLGTHCRLIFDLISANPGICSRELWNLYNVECGEKKHSAVSRRTFTDYLMELEELRLVRSEWIGVDGRSRKFWTVA